ncbi:hypothetical protein ACJD0Z_17485 [Flavobacteriaceae bacterium M23B6Z8]
MKTFFLIILFPVLNFSQNLAIELSIEWEIGTNSLVNEEQVNPFLVITLNNLSGDNIYLKDPFGRKSDYPEILDLSVHKLERDLATLKRIQNELVDEDDKYFVMINDMFIVLNELERKAFTSDEEFSTSFKASELSLVYDLLRSKHINQKATITAKDFQEYENKLIKEDTMEFEIFENELFIFLEANSKRKIRFDLIGFKILGGNYEFSFGNLKLEDDYLVSNGNNKELKRGLPKELKGYKLYTGSFFTNKIQIEF